MTRSHFALCMPTLVGFGCQGFAEGPYNIQDPYIPFCCGFQHCVLAQVSVLRRDVLRGNMGERSGQDARSRDQGHKLEHALGGACPVKPNVQSNPRRKMRSLRPCKSGNFCCNPPVSDYDQLGSGAADQYLVCFMGFEGFTGKNGVKRAKATKLIYLQGDLCLSSESQLGSAKPRIHFNFTFSSRPCLPLHCPPLRRPHARAETIICSVIAGLAGLFILTRFCCRRLSPGFRRPASDEGRCQIKIVWW